MDRIVPGRWLARLAVVAAALAVTSPSIPANARALASTGVLAPIHLPSQLPSALQASLSQQPVTLVSAVAADIDADGDLDIVGSDDQLALIVLVNDGQGHLSRRAPPRPGSWQPEPADPAVNDHGRAPHASVENDPPTARVDLAPAFGVRNPATFAPRGARPAVRPSAIDARASRAPPAALRS